MRTFLGSSAAIAALFSVGCASSGSPVHADSPLADDLDAFISAAFDEIEVAPGMGVAIYTPEGVYVRGFGVSSLRELQPVTEDTAFYIASTTKPMTGLLFARLDHQGVIDLDESIAEFAPEAPFSPAIDTDEIELRSLLTHTAGLSNDALSFRAAYTGDLTPETAWNLLAITQENNAHPYGQFQYTNMGYNILTTMTDQVVGVPWQDLLATEVFEPLGLQETSAYMSVANLPERSLARPHTGGYEGGPIQLELEKIDGSMQSAGGLVMSPSDAARWLEFLLERGALDGQQVFPAHLVEQTWERLATVPPGTSADYSQYEYENYGLGWHIGRYQDARIVHHPGGYAGYNAHFSFLPDHKVGVAVFVNEAPASHILPEVIANYVYDRQLGMSGEQALERAQDQISSWTAIRDEFISLNVQDQEARAAREWQMDLPLESYSGSYFHASYGTIHVTADAEGVSVEFGNLSAVGEAFEHPNAMRLEFEPYNGEVVVFRVDASHSRVEGLVFRGATQFEKIE